jgi:hypothetical protein
MSLSSPAIDVAALHSRETSARRAAAQRPGPTAEERHRAFVASIVRDRERRARRGRGSQLARALGAAAEGRA